MDTNKAMSDPDIVEMDFPPYAEEYSPFPDVEPDFNFEDNKEEIYRRNRIIAAEKQLAVLREENRQKLEKQEQYREMLEKSEPVKPQRRISIALLSSAMIVICFIFVIAVKTAVHDYDHDYDYVTTVQSAEVLQVYETKPVTRAATERKKRETTVAKEITEAAAETTAVPTETTTAEISPEVLKTTTVREPFAEDGSSYTYNTAVMSYRFNAENGGINEYGVKKVTIYVSVKNLTDYGYLVIPYFRSFRLTDSSGNCQDCYLADYDREHTHFSSSFKYEDDEEWREGSPVAFSFDENSLCEFSLDVYFDAGSDIEYDTFEYDPRNGFPMYYENADEGFEIPLENILKYII